MMANIYWWLLEMPNSKWIAMILPQKCTTSVFRYGVMFSEIVLLTITIVCDFYWLLMSVALCQEKFKYITHNIYIHLSICIYEQ